jgi:riboflavin biosynthesis pyrimidine reductase
LVEQDLVDELGLMVFPVVLGKRQETLRRYERQEAPAPGRYCFQFSTDRMAQVRIPVSSVSAVALFDDGT